MIVLIAGRCVSCGRWDVARDVSWDGFGDAEMVQIHISTRIGRLAARLRNNFRHRRGNGVPVECFVFLALAFRVFWCELLNPVGTNSQNPNHRQREGHNVKSIDITLGITRPQVKVR